MSHDLSNVQPLTSGFSERTFTLNLILTSPGVVSVRSCEVIGRRFRNRMSFSDLSDIAEVLHESFAISVRKCLQDIPDGAHVKSLPDFLIELPGLALSGVHVMIMEVKNGTRNAILRFTEFIGSINHVFKQNIGIEEPYATYTERLAVNVLADICLPIINLAREVEFAHQQAGTPVPQKLEDRTREFEFQMELLKRFITNAGPDGEMVHADQIDSDRRLRLLFPK